MSVKTFDTDVTQKYVRVTQIHIMKRDRVSEICAYCYFDVFTFVIYGKFAMLFWLPLLHGEIL